MEELMREAVALLLDRVERLNREFPERYEAAMIRLAAQSPWAGRRPG
jgi:hypothetical protein